MTAYNKTWTPISDKEIDEQIDLITNKRESKKELRPLSLVKFADDSEFRKAVGAGSIKYTSMNDFCNLLYLGPIPNQPGHGVYINLKNNTINVVDIEELVELSEDEI